MNWYKIAQSNIFYHASPIDNLDVVGIDPNASPHISREVQGWVYLGSEDYVIKHYLGYAKEGLYYIYTVDVNGLTLDENIHGEQIRTKDFIEPKRVTKKMTVKNSPHKHPLEEEYLEWWEKKNKKTPSMSQGISLWLDDQRDPQNSFIQREFGATGQEIWIKTVDEAKQYIMQGNVASISFDNDLGNDQEGYDLAKWIEEKAYYAEIPRLKWSVHSQNTVQSSKIKQAMENADKYWNDSR